MIWRRQRASINFAVRRQRQPVEKDESRRCHVFGQSAVQKSSQFTRAGFLTISRYDVRNQSSITGLILSCDHDAFGNFRVIAQRDFDLPKLDSVTMNLHLIIAAPEKLDPAVAKIACKIAGLVQTLAIIAERTGNELLRGRVRTIDVTARQASAADVQFARRAYGCRTQLPVENVSLHVCKRAPKGNRIRHWRCVFST